MDKTVQKLSTLAGTECHVLLHCQRIGPLVEVKYFAKYLLSSMLLTLSVIHNSLNTFLKIFVQNTIKMNPIVFLRGIVKKVADFNNMVNRSPVLRLMVYEILSASWPIFQKHILPSLMFLKTYGYVRQTGFSWHTFHFLIFYNFRRNDTEKKIVLLALSFLDYARKYIEEVMLVTNPRKRNFF
jgi:hypothetical protein